MYLREDVYDKVITELDSLEGYRQHGCFNIYEREKTEVITVVEEKVIAWAYLWKDIYSLRESDRLKSGDWRKVHTNFK